MLFFWLSMMPLCEILNLSSGSSQIIFQLCESVCSTLVILHQKVHLHIVFFGILCKHPLWVAWIFSYATCNCLLHEFSSRPSHSDCFPCVILLHVLLVLVIPRSTNSDSMIKLGRSLTLAILISAPQELHQTSKPSRHPNISECYVWSFRKHNLSCE